jgi:hypothetical protein
MAAVFRIRQRMQAFALAADPISRAASNFAEGPFLMVKTRLAAVVRTYEIPLGQIEGLLSDPPQRNMALCRVSAKRATV